MCLPNEGDVIKIQSYKHDGKLHRTWKKTTVLKATDQLLIGGNDRTLVVESDGRKWITREPAISYFHKEHWFNVISMIRADGVHHYCNIGSPYLIDNEALKYIDYDLDIKVFPNGSFHLLDEDEYEFRKRSMHYPEEVDRILKQQLGILTEWVLDKKGPFSDDYIDFWYYNQYRSLHPNNDVMKNTDL